jgi:hypothetical protein
MSTRRGRRHRAPPPDGVASGSLRLHPVGAALGYDACGVARVGLLDGELAERQALGLVGVEQGRPRLALDDGGQLPGEVVRVLNTAVDGYQRPALTAPRQR